MFYGETLQIIFVAKITIEANFFLTCKGSPAQSYAETKCIDIHHRSTHCMKIHDALILNSFISYNVSHSLNHITLSHQLHRFHGIIHLFILQKPL